MRSPVLTIAEGMKAKKQSKKKIGVGSVVKSNVVDIEYNTREGRIRRMSTEVVGCVHVVVGKKILLVKFEYGQKKDISSSSLVFLISKEEVDMDDPLYNYPEKEQGELLIIDGDTEVGEP